MQTNFPEDLVDNKEVGGVEQGRHDIIASLESTAQVLQAPAIVDYCDMKVGSGATDAVAQGEYNIQYLGTSSPIELQTLQGRQVDSEVQIGKSTHIVEVSTGCIVWDGGIENPLVMLYLYLPQGASFIVKHDEHAWPRFTQEGYYVVRAAREGAITDADVARQVAPRVD